MKPHWLVVLVACSSERDAPREPPAAPPVAGARQSIDPRVTGADVSIRGVELTPSARSPGVLELGYRVEAKDTSLHVPARIMCRVAGYNVVYPGSDEGKRPGPRLAMLFRPDPFAEPVEACEIAFFVNGAHVATTCYRNRELADGACPAGTFPAPPRVTAFSVELTRAILELRHGTALVSGLFTLAEPLPPGRQFATQIRCEDEAGIASGEGELAFLPLASIPVGASVFGPVAMFLDRTPAASATCDVRIVSRATSGAPTEHVHAHYCLTTGAVRAGDCSQK